MKMIHKNDIKRLQTIVDTSSSLGEKLSRFAGKTFKFIISKIGLIIGSIILSVVFFTLGAIGRRK
jgi:uncharacterized membrane-anchored protein